MGNRDMRYHHSQSGGRTLRHSNERNTLIDRLLMGLWRNLVPGKLQRNQKDDPS